MSGGETKEVVRPLQISSGAKADGWMCLTLHGVQRGWLVMYFTVGAEIHLAVQGCIEFTSRDDLAWAIFLRYATFDEKRVQPHGNKMHEFDNHAFGQMRIRESVDDPTGTLLDDLNSALNLSNVVIGRRIIDNNLRHEGLEALKFHIHHDCLNFNTGQGIHMNHLSEVPGKVGSCMCQCKFNSY